MTSPEGPFYSTLDADSEGEEGKFYVWTAAEIEQVLGEQGRRHVQRGLRRRAGRQLGRRPEHPPSAPRPSTQYARLNHMPEPELRRPPRGVPCRSYSSVREGRIRPGRDDKVLTAWNGLMIAALAQAAAVLDRPEYAADAARAADFILTQMRTPDGRLLRTWSRRLGSRS